MSSPSPSLQDLLDLLMPGGKPLGSPGKSKDVREMPGGLAAAEDFFKKLIVGGVPTPKPRHPGKVYSIPVGGFVGFRKKSKSGPPTICVDVPKLNLPFRKIKFI